MSLIRVTKDGEFLEVHEDALKEHKQMGWLEAPQQVIESVEDQEQSTSAIRKGPRGLWFKYDENVIASPGYATEEEAIAALTVG